MNFCFIEAMFMSISWHSGKQAGGLQDLICIFNMPEEQHERLTLIAVRKRGEIG